MDTTTKVGDAIKAKADEFTLAQLKASLEGYKEQANEAPDVWITMKDFNLKEGAKAESLTHFKMEGIACKALMEATGTAAQLAGMLAAGAASSAAGAVGSAEKAVAGLIGVGDKAAAAAGAAKGSVAASAKAGEEVKAIDFDFILSLEKVLGVEDIKATVEFTGSSLEAINKVMSSAALKTYVETTISHRVSAEITKWQNDQVEGAKTAVKDAVATAGAKASEAATAASAKAAEVVTAAGEKASEVAAKAKAAAKK